MGPFKAGPAFATIGKWLAWANELQWKAQRLPGHFVICRGQTAQMSESLADDSPALSIAAVERDTGISKDTLRAWERRYGFPSPRRDDAGDRMYPAEQVERLRRIKRLLDAGHRPAQVARLPVESLDGLLQRSLGLHARGAADAGAAQTVAPYIELLQRNDGDALQRALSLAVLRQGLAGFVTAVVAPLNTAVGNAWMLGRLQVHQEHLYTEVVQRVLRAAIASAARPEPSASPARVLLTTVPQEPHTLGLLMTEAMLILEGCHCVQLGAQTPLADIDAAVRDHAADIVALSFSTLLPAAQVLESLHELRRRLPAAVALWAGGSCAALSRAPAGVEVLREFADLARMLAQRRRPASV